MTRVFAGLFLSFALWGQIEQGSLVGVITDPVEPIVESMTALTGSE